MSNTSSVVKKIRSNQKFRFVVTGGINTSLDFGLLFVLRFLGLPVVTANIISTTISFVFSFFANRTYTFKSNGNDLKRELILFTLVTLFGLWVLQTLVIKGVLLALAPTPLEASLQLFIAKIIATMFSLSWNYLLYSRIVFTKK